LRSEEGRREEGSKGPRREGKFAVIFTRRTQAHAAQDSRFEAGRSWTDRVYDLVPRICNFEFRV